MVILKSLNEQIEIQIHEGQDLLLGRLLKCDIALVDPSISSRHARLKLTNDQLRVMDVGSTNGTRLNYSLITAPTYLQDGDTVEFGNLTFVVDGPQLTIPDEFNLSAQTLTSLELVESSQKLEDTMLSLELSEEEMAEANQVETDNLEAEVYIVSNQQQPLQISFMLALALILISGLLLLIHLWNIPPQI